MDRKETPTFLSDPARVLMVGDAVAAVVERGDGKVLMQHRDDKHGIWYPDHWGLFGGGVEADEDPEQAICRELFEELNWRPVRVAEFCDLEFNLKPVGLRRFYRKYYHVAATMADPASLVLGEGQDLRWMQIEEALTLEEVTPYDAFALFLFYKRTRLRAAS